MIQTLKIIWNNDPDIYALMTLDIENISTTFGEKPHFIKDFTLNIKTNIFTFDNFWGFIVFYNTFIDFTQNNLLSQFIDFNFFTFDSNPSGIDSFKFFYYDNINFSEYTVTNIFLYQTTPTTPTTPTITNFSIATKTYGDAPFTITQPSSNSSGSFSYTSSNTLVATISENTITIVGAGSSTITATQAATTDYTSGTITTTFQVNQSTPTNPAIINNGNELLYFMGTSSNYANITNDLEINYDLITTSYKVLTGNNIKITKSNN